MISNVRSPYLVVLFAAFLLAGPAAAAELCSGFGPQSPRDITQTDGSNPVDFAPAAPSSELNLCNIHFHKNAEHKGPGYTTFAGEGDYGGYACDAGGDAGEGMVCDNVQAGDTIEVHWVFTSCDVEPGPGLGSCLSDACSNPQLRVEAQVFRVEADGEHDFAAFGEVPGEDGYQPKALPPGDGLVTYLGSTTGPSFDAAVCSPLQVTWSVRPQCQSLDMASLGAWCEDNRYDESKAHGVRQLVTELPLLSQIGD